MPQCHVLVVGGGSAGALMAARLSEDPKRKVILLERGPDFADDEMPRHLRYAYMASAATSPGCTAEERGSMLREVSKSGHLLLFLGGKRTGNTIIPRGEVMGGSSAVNAGIYLWGVPEDYDHWAELGNPSWAYAKVKPAFAAIETDLDFPKAPHGTSGGVKVRRPPKASWHPMSRAYFEAARAAGHAEVADFNDPDTCPTGVGPMPFNVEAGVRYSSAIAFLGPEVRRRPNLTIVGGVLVHKLVLDGRRAVAVLADVDGKPQRYDADEIVLSAGSVRSPQILLLSGIGPAAHLREQGLEVRHDLPGVGENLQDHPCANLWFQVSPAFPMPSDFNGIEVTLRYTAEGSRFRNDLQVNCRLGSVLYDPDQTVSRVDPSMIGLGVHLYRTLGTGTLRLDGTDPRKQPKLDYRYLENDEDRARMRRGVRDVFAMAEGGFGGMIATPDRLHAVAQGLTRKDAQDDAKLDAWLFGAVMTGQHTSSTCKMGPASDPLAVVDEHGRVHGLERLRVVDSSIMPTCMRANTNAPSMMIAQHIATSALAEKQL